MSDDNYREFVKHFQKNEAAIRCFVRSLMPSWNDVDDVMQDISLVLWDKFPEFKPGSDFRRWAYVIARFKVMNHNSKKKNNKLQFDSDILDLMAEESHDEIELRNLEVKAMQDCISQLPQAKQKLILSPYQNGITIKDLAEQIGKTPTALYKVLNRIRMILFNCIQNQLKSEGLK